MASSFEKSRCIILPRVSFCPGLPYLSFVISRSVHDLEANISFEYDKVYFKVSVWHIAESEWYKPRSII